VTDRAGSGACSYYTATTSTGSSAAISDTLASSQRRRLERYCTATLTRRSVAAAAQPDAAATAARWPSQAPAHVTSPIQPFTHCSDIRSCHKRILNPTPITYKRKMAVVSKRQWFSFWQYFVLADVPLAP